MKASGLMLRVALALSSSAALLTAPSNQNKAPLALTAAADDGPITKVVTLLTDLKGRINDDQNLEQTAYDKFACYCEATSAKTAATITELRSSLGSVGNMVLQKRGEVQSLNRAISTTKHTIVEKEEARDKMTKIRTDEHAAFMAETTEEKQAIGALQKALEVLDGAGVKASMLQGAAQSVVSDALNHVQRTVEKSPHAHMQSTQKLLAALSEARISSQRYAPQSATIVGILKDMYESFAQNLETATVDEAKANMNFEKLMGSYKKELADLNSYLEGSETKKAEAEAMLADANQQYGDEIQQLDESTAFFDTTKEKCNTKTSEWSTRSKLRTEELDGITKALEILEANRAHFDKALGFIQLTSTPIEKASDALQRHAQASHSLRLASLATSLRAGGQFDAVIVQIDKLLVMIQSEQGDDDRRNAQCKDETQANELAKGKHTWEVEKLNGELTSLGEQIKANEAAALATQQASTEAQTALTAATTERGTENGLFKEGKADDLKAIELLQQAMTFLKAYYDKHPVPSASLVQQEPSEKASDATFSKADSRSGESKGVLELLQQIVENFQTEISQAQKAEADAQLLFEKEEKRLTELMDTLKERHANLAVEHGDLEQKVIDTTSDRDGSQASLDDATKKQTDISGYCNWLQTNLETRRANRVKETEGLKMAKNFLAGQTMPKL